MERQSLWAEEVGRRSAHAGSERSALLTERVAQQQMVLHHAAADEVLLDDAFEPEGARGNPTQDLVLLRKR